ncbi:MAG: PQQ-dependent sugar dehydrogenase [Candidatus Thermoplasmatota archaeon]|nr:PQQ-dependent sugar dehydrogenase [Candidatus Thermoplasmatota archaeon]
MVVLAVPMRAFAALLLVTLLVLPGCLSPEPRTGELDEVTPPGGPGEHPESRIAVVALGLATIWVIAFSPDSRVFLTQRAGTITVLDAEGQASTWRTVDGAASGESGLMGLALHPAFPQQPWVYACYTYRNDDGELTNRISRFQEQEGQGGAEEILLDGLDGAGIHDGCRLAFGPDGNLHATMGDAARASRAQDPRSPNGKVLRMSPTGTPAGALEGGHPYVYTMGHRNPQGLAFHPATGEAYISEHGPENHDEVNRLVPGANYGWPQARGPDDGDGAYQGSLWTSGAGGTVAPAGAAFIQAEGSPLDHAFVFGTLKASQLHVLLADGSDDRLEAEDRVALSEEFGRLRAVTWGPDGALYLGTSNRDGRGQPGPQDDRVLRVPLGVLEDALGLAG